MTDQTPSSAYGWMPVWALPNVTIDEPIEASRVALVPCTDGRLRAAAHDSPSLTTFLNAFTDEFGKKIWPTVGMVRANAEKVKNVEAVGAFRDAVCISAIVAGHAHTMNAGRPLGILHSDAFDVYPWFLTQMSGHIGAFTPAVQALHSVGELRPQSAPALGNRWLTSSQIDVPLLRALLERWEACFGDDTMTAPDRRLFRSLEMARAASKTPGGSCDRTRRRPGGLALGKRF